MIDKKGDENSRVLLIDDEKALLNALTAALESDGLKCEKAITAGEALSILDKTASIELIISDIRMPGMDGITLLKQVRERYRDRPWLQVIFITAYATLENSVDALRLAATDFLYKPVRREVLVNSARSALGKAAQLKGDLEFKLQGAGHLDRLAEELQMLKALIKPVAVEPSQNLPEENSTKRKSTPLSKERLLALVQSNEIKKKLFKDDLFSDPVWNMLLDLMQQSLMGNEVAVSALYYSSGAPIATASRRLTEMESAGLVTRLQDPSDKRRQFVTISQDAYNMIEQYFRAIDEL